MQFRALLRIARQPTAGMNRPLDEVTRPLRSLGRRSGPLTRLKVRPTIRRFGSSINPMICRPDLAEPDPARFVGGAMGFTVGISANG